MAVSQPKKTLSKDEVIEILRANARLFKDEPEFITYIVDLAIYLLEHCLEREARDEKSPASAFIATQKDLKEIMGVFERFVASKKETKRACPMCGAPVEGKRKCPNCDAMTF